MSTITSLGYLEFTSLVPTWIIMFSGSFLRMGLIKSSMPSVVALANGFTTTFWMIAVFQQIDFSVCRLNQLFLWSFILFVAVVHPVRILLQSSAMPSFVAPLPPRSFTHPFKVSSCPATLSKPFRCLWTQLSLCVMALRTGINDKRGLVEPLY